MYLIALLACAPETPPQLSSPVLPATEPDAPTLLPQLEPEEALWLEHDLPTGSTNIVEGPGGDGLYMVDAFNGHLLHVHQQGPIDRYPIAGEPTRLARVGSTLYVTLRYSGELLALDLQGRELARVDVGLEPIGVVATTDGRRIYVASSLSGQVVELHGADLSVLRTFPVGGEPRHLALDEERGLLHVAALFNQALVETIDLATGQASTYELPAVLRGNEAAVDARVSGDPWVVPESGALLVPVLYFDPTTPVITTEPVPIEPPEPHEPAEGYGGTSNGIGLDIHPGKLAPAVVKIEPDGTTSALFAGTLLAGSALTSVRSEPGGTMIVGTMQGSDAVLYLDPTRPVDNPGPTLPGAPLLSPSQAGYEHVATALVGSCVQPTGLVWNEHGVRVYCPEESALADGRSVFADLQLQLNGVQGVNLAERAQPQGVQQLPVASPAIDAWIIEGRRLFHSESLGGGGVSCATCHIEGRTDGVSWNFDFGSRQTPSLAGLVSETGPFTWTQDVLTVQEDAAITAELRMGGEPLSDAEADAIAAYIDWVRPVRRPAPDEAAQRGQLLFEDASVGCSECHSGPTMSDGELHLVRSLWVDTPTLNGIGATAPYLRDGVAATLHDALDPQLHGGLANTAHLTDAERDDLVAYLLTL